MNINPQHNLHTKWFYNNLCLLVTLFCIACFSTSIFFNNAVQQQQTEHALKEEALFGPIQITTNPKVYRIIAEFSGRNSDTYLTGEVLDADKETLYEFGKELWQEEGTDSEGYWVEDDKKMVADLAFTEKGTYYVQFSSDQNLHLPQAERQKFWMRSTALTMQLMSGSYVIHLEVGTFFLIFMMLAFYVVNQDWVHQQMALI